MYEITSAKAAKILNITVENLAILEHKGVIHSTRVGMGVVFYSKREIEEIKSREGISLSDEASQIESEMQREVIASTANIKKVLRFAGSILSVYFLSIGILTVLFSLFPLETASWLGYLPKVKEDTSFELDSNSKVLAATTNSLPQNVPLPLQAALQPVGKISLNLVKFVNPNSYSQIASATILDTNDVLVPDDSGAIIPIRPIKFPEASLLEISDSGLVLNLNSQYLQGKIPGINVGDLAVVSGSDIENSDLENSSLTINTSGILFGGGPIALGETITLSCPTCASEENVGTPGTYGSVSSIPILTTDAQGRVSGVADTIISGLSVSNFGSSNISQWLNNTGYITAISTDTLSAKIISAASNTISGLTNINFNGTAGITNGNLANSSISIAGNSGSGSSTLGGTLTFTGSGITNVVATGSTLTFTSTEADTFTTVTTRGASTATELTVNGGITTTTTTALTLDTGTTGAVSIGTGANTKNITIGNVTGATSLNLNSGTGNITFTVDGISSSGKVQIGNSGTTTPDLLVLDNGTGDPTGINGGMYYNSSTGKFRCFENGAWSNCIGLTLTSNLQHSASYDNNEAFVNIPTGGAQVLLGTVSVTPTRATGDVLVTGWADVYSSNGADQPLQIVIETTNNCTGSIVGNASVTYTIVIGASALNDRGSIKISGIAIDPGISTQDYSLCAAVTSGVGDSDILNWGIDALVIDTGAN